jgi:hypothetical protein
MPGGACSDLPPQSLRRRRLPASRHDCRASSSARPLTSGRSKPTSMRPQNRKGGNAARLLPQRRCHGDIGLDSLLFAAEVADCAAAARDNAQAAPRRTAWPPDNVDSFASRRSTNAPAARQPHHGRATAARRPRLARHEMAARVSRQSRRQGPSHCSKLLSHRGLIPIPTMNGCTSRQLVLFTYHRADRRFEQEIGTKGHDTTGHPKS